MSFCARSWCCICTELLPRSFQSKFKEARRPQERRESLNMLPCYVRKLLRHAEFLLERKHSSPNVNSCDFVDFKRCCITGTGSNRVLGCRSVLSLVPFDVRNHRFVLNICVNHACVHKRYRRLVALFLHRLLHAHFWARINIRRAFKLDYKAGANVCAKASWHLRVRKVYFLQRNAS